MNEFSNEEYTKIQAKCSLDRLSWREKLSIFFTPDKPFFTFKLEGGNNNFYLNLMPISMVITRR